MKMYPQQNPQNQYPQPMGGGAGSILPSVQNSGTMVEMTRAMAEVMGLVQIARMNPRHQLQAEQRIKDACKRKALAEAAVYSYPRGGEQVTGPSIRLAEVLAQNWGNLDFGVRDLESRIGADGTTEVVMVAYCWDLETNVRQVKQFTVKMEREKKSGNQKLTGARDMYELGANMGARRLRACILGVIPGDIVDAALEQCEKTLMTNAEPIKERVRKMVNAFSEQGVTVEMIERRLKHSAENVTEKEILDLQRLYRALKDGFTSREEAFAFEAPGGSTIAATLSAGLANAQTAAAAAPAQAQPAPRPEWTPPPAQTSVSPQTTETKEHAAAPAPAPTAKRKPETKAQFKEAIVAFGKERGMNEFDLNVAIGQQYEGAGIEDLSLDQLKQFYNGLGR